MSIRLIHNLAFTLVLYHSLVGCCAHHAHATLASAEGFGGALQAPGKAMSPAGELPLPCLCDRHAHRHRSVPDAHPDHHDAHADRQGLPQPPGSCTTKCVFVVPDGGAAVQVPAPLPTWQLTPLVSPAAESSSSRQGPWATLDRALSGLTVQPRTEVLLL